MNSLCWLPAFILVGFLANSGCDAQERSNSTHPDTYSAESIEGWVVDAATNEPLESVIVVAAWILYGWTMPGIKFDQVGTLELKESVTDKNGRYFFPGWGPLKRASMSVLTDYDPQLLFFKSGYDVRILANPFQEEISNKALRTSQWNGKTIKLHKFEGSFQQYALRVQRLGDGPISRALEDCSWRKIPRMITAMYFEDRLLQKHGSGGIMVEQILPKPGEKDVCNAVNFLNRITVQ